ncbi:RmlC-like cupin [Paraphaeosphaeria sporulosa]|uniref:RmlC-like cupin n=1 Tax=Paraphaeosphaeria sporulosa TaxID=1460663 RepID=A0A177C5B6_9PLEO|nr:RmlC-like cupin [Paraphaeosphaeria sporulosa]OAG02705.1 RmlC-like cupin [Paraphaeosphaeria sporulosa]
MPSTIFPAHQPSKPAQRAGPTFTGTVYSDVIHRDATVSLANVTFTPCSRTFWHTHEDGQMIKVLSGSGLVCDAGGAPRRIQAGDVVWAAPGTTHWHGADEASVMTHFVVTRGKTVWGEEVVGDGWPRVEGAERG